MTRYASYGCEGRVTGETEKAMALKLRLELAA
jgi:hypothetical protein